MDQNTLNRLEKTIQHEIRVYEGYNALTELEKKVIAPFSPEKVLDAAGRREQFVEEMSRLSNQRIEILQSLGIDKTKRLTEILPQILKGSDLKRLMALANKLKTVALSSQKDTRDLSNVMRFGMGMVDGLLSIFWSATRHVTKSYTRMGGIQESSTPAGNRESSVLKKA